VFDKLKAMGAMASLMKNQDKLKDAGERIRLRAESIRVTGEAGGGAARAVVSGSMRVVSIELAPGLINGMALDEKTRSLAGTLITDAVNDGLRQAQTKLKAALDDEAKGLGLEGGLPDLPGLAGV